jgi:hypothetical protein
MKTLALTLLLAFAANTSAEYNTAYETNDWYQYTCKVDNMDSFPFQDGVDEALVGWRYFSDGWTTNDLIFESDALVYIDGKGARAQGPGQSAYLAFNELIHGLLVEIRGGAHVGIQVWRYNAGWTDQYRTAVYKPGVNGATVVGVVFERPVSHVRVFTLWTDTLQIDGIYPAYALKDQGWPGCEASSGE